MNLDTLRVETARRVINETENKLVFVGDSAYAIPGLINVVGNISEDIAQGAAAGTPAFKRLWVNKTPKEILADLRTAKLKASVGGLFEPDALILPPDQYEALTQPYSDQSPLTILSWLNTQGMYFKTIMKARELSAAFNGLTPAADCFIVMESSREVAEIAVVRDITLLPPVYDVLYNSEQAVIQSTAGAIIRHPSAIYVGRVC